MSSRDFPALAGSAEGTREPDNPNNVAEANLSAVEYQARRAVEIADALKRGFATV
ncbi:hypothetical protein [Streptomyces sp. NPDC048603]|uniref:hypothetical protein n=1 Tax=Streptomyces sp. NPDC048603 TaxID=3365577 RepID=UPI0037114E7C